jgi:formyltetrahydrofolate-dependent phosphoribosylglycinamide formyltransferase
MFNRLKARWKVNSWSLLLILTTFALGGSTCARLGKWLLPSDLAINPIAWWVLYLTLVTLLWPCCVLFYSIPLGQFQFFKNYLKRIASRMFGKKSTPITSIPQLAAFASGTGTNVKKLIESEFNKAAYNIALVVTNKPTAPVVQMAENHQIPVLILEKKDLENPKRLLEIFREQKIDAIVLAGYLKKIQPELIKAYPDRIFNIHPALLPKYGGKGMYGKLVHEAVINAGEVNSGITIHLVNEEYDRGQILYQEEVSLSINETPESLSEKIQQLEHKNYAAVIVNHLKSLTSR